MKIVEEQKLQETIQQNEMMALRAKIELENEEQRAIIQRQKEELEAEKISNATKLELTKQELEHQQLQDEAINKAIDTQARKDAQEDNSNLKKIEKQRLMREEESNQARDRHRRFMGWLKAILFVILIIFLIVAAIIGLYRLYRWTVEEPLIKEIDKIVEVERIVEKEVEIEKIVEKEVIPEECTQIRRNGKIYVSCDGVSVDGAPTISDSGVGEIPDLVTE
ncbi:hypothetical protein A6E03_12265 [Aliivibrio sp. 1S128]|nr:hypothetical protein A6E03_12265 [Aliivibrio sp. 1S128]